MRYGLSLATCVAIVSIAMLTTPRPVAAQPKATEPAPTRIQPPASIRTEHEEIHSRLVEATKAPGRVGAAAKELAAVLHPHFVREEEIALPPLGLLAPLAAGDPVPETVLSEALTMTDSLRSELPRMLEEHEKIRAAVERLRTAARDEGARKYERLAEQLALHARTEEEVLYPAALLVGDVIRARLRKPPAE